MCGKTNGNRAKGPISNVTLRIAYDEFVQNNELPDEVTIKRLLKKRAIRTLSGVAPIAIFLKPAPCPGKCVYCPTEQNVPKSYNSNEPGVMRAIANQYDPRKQIQARIRTLRHTGHANDKVEMIVMGGTISSLPKSYQEDFMRTVYATLNDPESVDTPDSTLEELQTANETAFHRCVGLTLETRPDFIQPKEIEWMRHMGATRVEIGVQNIYDEVLEKNKRGHGIKSVIKATKLLKEAGFKVCYHTMPNMYGSDMDKDFQMYEELFSNPDLQPDQIKIYPCVVTHDAELQRYWKDGLYKPYEDEELIDLLLRVKKIMPPYTRIVRLGRDIPATNIVAGNTMTNIREVLHDRMEKQGWFCKCIRCREVRDIDCDPTSAILKTEQYEASGGIEYFLRFTSPDEKLLFAHLRLRITESALKNQDHPIPVLDRSAVIRELHTYGELTPVQEKGEKVQHTGFGRQLMTEAEKLTREHGVKRLAVISGVGVRPYYTKLGFTLAEGYMIKDVL